MIQLKRFCFCIPLTTGGVILGIMTFLWTAFAFYVHAVRVKYDQEMDWLFWTSLVVAVLSVITSVLLIYGSVTVRETYVSRRIVQKMSLPLSLFFPPLPHSDAKSFWFPTWSSTSWTLLFPCFSVLVQICTGLNWTGCCSWKCWLWVSDTDKTISGSSVKIKYFWSFSIPSVPLCLRPLTLPSAW